MKILIPKNKAITLLSERVKETEDWDFNETVWKSRTEDDVKEIFGVNDKKTLEVKFFKFNADIYGKIPPPGKKAAAKLVEGYIKFIKDYAEEVAHIEVAIPSYKAEYDNLKISYILVGQANEKLEQDIRVIHQDNAKLLSIINEQRAEIKSLKENVFQTENITIIRLWRFFVHLPWPSTLAILGILVAAFLLGAWAEHHHLLPG
jgi:hypothetical protein